ncbi:MAG: hypothetical protein HZB38_17100 [Planctomycetes bacterium]|nr:hypothetical protein [Planctomycetota bacterium]
MPALRDRLARLTIVGGVIFASATIPAQAAPPQETPAPTSAAAAEDEAAKAEKERRELARKLDRTRRDIELAEMRLQKTRMQNEIAEQQHGLAAAKARKDIEVAARKLKNFREKSKPERINRADLSLAYSQDNVRESEQELEQLEIMYKDDKFADKTKEIVLERGRRRLERARRSLQLEAEANDFLKAETLPLEELEQDLALKDKQDSLEKTLREHEIALIDQRMGLISGEAEITKLRDDLADTERDLKDFDRKQAEKAAKAASQPASASQPAK